MKKTRKTKDLENAILECYALTKEEYTGPAMRKISEILLETMVKYNFKS